MAFAKPQPRRAPSSCSSRSWCRSRRSTRRSSALEQAENRQRAAAAQLVIAQRQGGGSHAPTSRRPRAAVERAEEELANATIKAPIRGTVLTRDVEIGSPVSSILNLGANATLVMTLGDIEQVFVRGKVDEADIGRVRLGQPARITTETLPATRCSTASVTQISPIGVEKDNVTTFEVEVSIDNPGKELKANMTANAEIVLEERPNSLHRARSRRSATTRRTQRVRRRRRSRAPTAAAARCR